MILLDESLAVTDKEASGEVTQNGIATSPRSTRTSQPTTETPPTREPEDGARVASTPEPDRARVITKVKLPKLTLRKFGGGLTSWATFWDSFESSIHQNPDLSQVDKFNYLHSLVDGTAAEAIAGLALTSSNYEVAIKVLKKRFGYKQQQISKHMDVLLQLEGVNSSLNIKGLRYLYDKVESQVRSLKALGVDPSSYGSLLASILLSKIPQDLCLMVSREVSQDEWDFEAIVKVIEKEVEARERAVDSSVNKKNVRSVPTAASLLAGSAKSEQVSCCYCEQNHSAACCKTVTDIGVKDILMKSGRCFVCLRRGHKAKGCRSPYKCSACGRKHHVSVCNTSAGTLDSSGARRSEQPPTASQTTVTPSLMRASQSSQLSSTSMFVDTRTPVFLQTARTAVYNPDTPMVTHNTCILFDAGSHRSYIVSRVRDILHLPTEHVESLVVKTFGSEIGRHQRCDLVNLCVKVKRGVDITVPLLTVPTICEPFCGQPIIRALKRYCYLSKLDLADSGAPNDSLDVGIVIGANLYWLFITGRTRQGSGPTAIETKLGWILSGPVVSRDCLNEFTLVSHTESRNFPCDGR